jgi:hypothetical protein
MVAVRDWGDVQELPRLTNPAGDQQNEEVERSGAYHGQWTMAQPDRGEMLGRKSRAIDFRDTTAGGDRRNYLSVLQNAEPLMER